MATSVERDILDRPVLRGDGRPRASGAPAPAGRTRRDRRRSASSACPPGQHQDDEGARQVLAQQHGGHDGDPGEQVGAEASAGQPGGKLHDERAAAGRQADVEREVERRLRRSRPEAKADIRRDRRKRQGGDRQVTRQVRTWSSCRSATAACVNGWRVPGCFLST